MSSDDDPILEGYWKKVLDAWDDDARHKQFVAYAAQTKQLAEAARRYRSIAKPDASPADPSPPDASPADASPPDASPADASPPDEEDDRRADAAKRLEGIAAAAVMMLASEPRTEPIDAKRVGRRIALGFAVVVFAVLAYLMGVMFTAR